MTTQYITERTSVHSVATVKTHVCAVTMTWTYYVSWLHSSLRMFLYILIFVNIIKKIILCVAFFNTSAKGTCTYTKQTYPASTKIWKLSLQISKYVLPLEPEKLQLEQTKFPWFSLCFGKNSKFHVFPLTGIFFCHFPCFPCAVGTL